MAITKVPAYGLSSQSVKNTLAPTPAKIKMLPPMMGGSLGTGLTDAAKQLAQSFAAPSFIVPPSQYAAIPASAASTGVGAGADGTPPPSMGQIDPSVYLAQLTGDPLYQTGLKSYQDTIQANQNALSAALKQSIIQGGWAPGAGAGQVNLASVGGQDLSGDIDQATIDSANANQMSDRAQLQTQLNKGLADIPSQLAARGASRSGAANIAAANTQNQYDVAANQALQNLSQAIGGNVGTWASNNAAALGNWNSAQTNVADRLASIAQANAQAQYQSDLASYNANQAQTVTAGNTQITTAPAGPSPKTVANVAKVKAVVAKKVPGGGSLGSSASAAAKALSKSLGGR